MSARERVDAIKALLRERGLQATAARIAVLQSLAEAHEHLTADEIRADVLERYPAIDPATVYRTLETMENHGLAVRVELGGKLTRWAHVTQSHHHLACRRCGAIVELDDGPFRRLSDELRALYGIQADLQHLVVRGLCPPCAAPPKM